MSTAALVARQSSNANHFTMSTTNRRAKVTPETEAEAVRLRSIWDATQNKPSQAVFGDRYNIGSQGAVALFLSGTTPLSKKAAKGFADGLGCRVEDFSPRLAEEIYALTLPNEGNEEDDFTQVRRVDVSLSAGHGALVFEEPSKSALTFRRSFLQEIGVTPKNAVIVTVKGHSMDPTLRDGAVLLVNTAAKTVANGQIYAFRRDGQLYVKRMHQAKDGGYLAVSDNPDREQYPTMHIDYNEADFEVIGRALWMGARL
jgi:phage repressor protein C with HTH and peptisase S24 domain